MKSLIIAIAFLLFQTHLVAKEPILLPSGYQPLKIHRIADTVHVFCNGNDIDYDGVYEPTSGEKPAMWLMYDANTNIPVKAMVMENGYFSVPFRPGFSSTNMYLPRNNRIEVYDLSTQKLIDSSLVSFPEAKSTITGVYVLTMQQSGVEIDIALAISHKTSFTESGKMSLFSISSKQLLLQKDVGINPQMIRGYRNLRGQLELAVLCEGTFGGGNSALYLVNTAPSSGESDITIYELGDTGNHFIIQDQLALTVMNGSHEIIPINLATKAVLPSIPVGTTGYDGPREIIVDSISNRVYVSTYASDIRIGSFLDGTVLGQWFPQGKPEGMALINNTLWVCNAFKRGDYTPDSTIAIFSLDESTSVQEEMEQHVGGIISVNNGTCTIKTDIELEHAQYNVWNTNGVSVLNGMFNGKEHKVSLGGLPQGVYIISIKSPKLTMSTMVISKD